MLQLAKSAADAGNPKEAYDYYTKVLEHEPRNLTAWLGKGESAGWMSTVKDLRTTEMLAAFANCIKYAAVADQPLTRKKCADSILSVSTACYSITRNHLLKFVRVPGAWPHFIGNSGHILAALMIAHSYDLENKKIVETIIQICSDNIRGMSWSPDVFGLFKQTVTLPPDYEAHLRGTLDEYTAKMYRLDPAFVKPQL